MHISCGPTYVSSDNQAAETTTTLYPDIYSLTTSPESQNMPPQVEERDDEFDLEIFDQDMDSLFDFGGEVMKDEDQTTGEEDEGMEEDVQGEGMEEEEEEEDEEGEFEDLMGDFYGEEGLMEDFGSTPSESSPVPAIDPLSEW